MGRYRVVLRELVTGEECVRQVSMPYDNAALCAALGGFTWPFSRSDVERARRMAGVYPAKPPDQKYQLVSIERTDDPCAVPKRTHKPKIPKGPEGDSPDGDMDRFLGERNEL